ncbi:SDR family oxidoreductase [Mesorhizobium sp. ASY16-5R]|uniref:SDR family oxidoreductase n=1 Tax=Mesorhizobium sp. ASY16-5R TaxID=3445772 RepID=UPI003FA120E2
MVGRLDGKVAVITGAGRGIGEATARAMAAEGAIVVVAEKDAESGGRVVASLTAGGARSLFIETDVADAASCEAMAEDALKKFGGIDILVANAGINVFHEPLETSEEEWRRCFAVDLDGVWYSAKAVLPAMRGRKAGSVVAIASCHSFAIIPSTFPYPVAKHGLLGLVRALGVQYAADGIRVNAIAPGYIETQIAVDYWNTFADPQAERQRTYDLHPPRRIGRPEEVAMTAVFLGSDEAPFINAACIVIDGGRSVLYHE